MALEKSRNKPEYGRHSSEDREKKTGQLYSRAGGEASEVGEGDKLKQRGDLREAKW